MQCSSDIINNKSKPCLVAYSVLKEEIEKLKKQGKLDAEVIYVNKYFHVDYSQIDKNLRLVLKKAIKQYPANVFSSMATSAWE